MFFFFFFGIINFLNSDYVFPSGPKEEWSRRTGSSPVHLHLFWQELFLITDATMTEYRSGDENPAPRSHTLMEKRCPFLVGLFSMLINLLGIPH